VKDQQLQELIEEAEEQLRQLPRTRWAAKKKNEPRTSLLFDSADPLASQKITALIEEIEGH
jgi:hypothetical protein